MLEGNNAATKSESNLLVLHCGVAEKIRQHPAMTTDYL